MRVAMTMTLVAMMMDTVALVMTATCSSWRRFVKEIIHIKKLQRIFNCSGKALQWYPRTMLDAVTKHFAKQ